MGDGGWEFGGSYVLREEATADDLLGWRRGSEVQDANGVVGGVAKRAFFEDEARCCRELADGVRLSRSKCFMPVEYAGEPCARGLRLLQIWCIGDVVALHPLACLQDVIGSEADL